MPNIATVLKAEVTRLARKELRSETQSLRKTIYAQRSELAAFKRRIHELEKVVQLVVRSASPTKPVASEVTDNESSEQIRFRAAGMANNRKRLGLSAAEFGLLVGATGQSVYAWEAGKSKPRAQSLAAIKSLRGVGKKEVASRLAALKG